MLRLPSRSWSIKLYIPFGNHTKTFDDKIGITRNLLIWLNKLNSKWPKTCKRLKWAPFSFSFFLFLFLIWKARLANILRIRPYNAHRQRNIIWWFSSFPCKIILLSVCRLCPILTYKKTNKKNWPLTIFSNVASHICFFFFLVSNTGLSQLHYTSASCGNATAELSHTKHRAYRHSPRYKMVTKLI